MLHTYIIYDKTVKTVYIFVVLFIYLLFCLYICSVYIFVLFIYLFCDAMFGSFSQYLVNLMLQIYRLLESTCTVLCGWLASSTVQLTNFRSNQDKTVFRNKIRTVSFYLYNTTIEYLILYSCWKNEFLEHFLGFSVFSSRISGIQCLKHNHCISC